MIWSIVSSQSCFCWLYRASPYLAVKNNQSDFSIDHLVISMCRFISGVVGRGCLLWPVLSLGKTLSFCPASFYTPRANLPFTPCISWLPTFAFQSPIMRSSLVAEVKASACNVGDLGLIPRSGRSPGEGNGYPLWYSCLENSMEREAWQATVHRVAESDMTERL